MSITIVYNRVNIVNFGKAQDIIADKDTISMAKKIAKTLVKKGHKIALLELNKKTVSDLVKIKTDYFFNLCGGIGDLPHTEGLAAGILIKTGVPVVGSTQQVIELTTDKAATKKIFLKNNLPTPKFIVAFDHKVNLKGLHFPLILKPVNEDCSLGISQKSVFKHKTGLGKKIQELLALYHEPVLIEEFIDGRELRVSIVGNGKHKIVLPISELVFGKSFKNKFKIFDFSAKWLPGTTSYEDTYAVSPADLPPVLQKKIAAISLKAYEMTGCSDYGRVDIRLDLKNRPFILEINANPAIGPDDAFSTSAKAAGMTHGDLLEKIILSHENNRRL